MSMDLTLADLVVVQLQEEQTYMATGVLLHHTNEKNYINIFNILFLIKLYDECS